MLTAESPPIKRLSFNQLKEDSSRHKSHSLDEEEHKLPIITKEISGSQTHEDKSSISLFQSENDYFDYDIVSMFSGQQTCP